MGTRKLVVLVGLCAVTMQGCSADKIVVFATPAAQLAHQDLASLVRREPTTSGQIGNAIVLHRIVRGETWFIGYRKFSQGGPLAGTDSENFTKVSIEIPAIGKPSGVYTLGSETARAYVSAGAISNSGNFGCYASISNGTITLSWNDATSFTLTLSASIEPDEFHPKERKCPPMILDEKATGELLPFNRLTPWHGVPVSYSLETSAETFHEGWPDAT